MATPPEQPDLRVNTAAQSMTDENRGGEDAPQNHSQQQSTIDTPSDVFYTAEKIVRSKKAQNELWFAIRWPIGPDGIRPKNSWSTLEDVNQPLLDAYYKIFTKTGTKRRSPLAIIAE